MADAPVEVFRSDYRPLPYTVSTVSMDFDVRDGETTVTTTMRFARNPVHNADENGAEENVVLDGDESSVTLVSLEMNGRSLTEGVDYELAPGRLVLRSSLFEQSENKDEDSSSSVLTSVVTIVPETNTQLSGLYKSGPMYCTQCEATGFRRITYYPDRPDNMAVFERVSLTANKEAYPVLLSNGNLVSESDAGDGRHTAVWSDPHPKPSYLFCVVAGDLGSVSDTFVTRSGRKVDLCVYSEHENVGRLQHAIDSLINSMKWDEDVYGLEYDLDLYNIVAVNDFNMGAMENKGLNVFNTACVLADPVTASDGDFGRVEGVIGHEYFHNWTGNRVTCRDWFQLTLKEGLTVFRDRQFTGDMSGSHDVKRIEDVTGLRGRQFNEDAGPMSHPVRPESYISMDNFYTSTVYEKGAEVVRMYETLLGREGFRKGMDLYFERHDGDAVTCDDFRSAMADANGVNLDQFARWYRTKGTPTVTYDGQYDEVTGTYALTLTQTSESTDGPLHIPLSVGLLDKVTGKEVVSTTVLDLKEDTQTFTFENLEGDVIPSLLRGFSAPIKLVAKDANNDDESATTTFLAANDTDGFNRWEATQKVYTAAVEATMTKKIDVDHKSVFTVFGRILEEANAGTSTDYSLRAFAMTIPSEGTLAENQEVVDPVAIREARGAVKKALAERFREPLRALYDRLTSDMTNLAFSVDAENVGRRRLRNTALGYLCALDNDDGAAAAVLAASHYKHASGMTDKLAALSALVSLGGTDDDNAATAAREHAVRTFHEEANGDPLVLNKWFTVQAGSHLPDATDRVRKLVDHPDFTLSNPNRCRALLGAYAANAAAFHTAEGYQFMGDMVEQIDRLNPQMSSRMARSLITWRRYDYETRGKLMKAELEKLKTMEGISDDLFEIVSRGLK